MATRKGSGQKAKGKYTCLAGDHVGAYTINMITNLYNNIRLFEKGTKFFSDETQVLIAKHVLETVCTEVTNILVTFSTNFLPAAELMMSVDSQITSEARVNIILGKLPDETKGPLMKLHNCLNGKIIEDFLTCFETSAEVCGFMLMKKNKSQQRQAMFVHRQSLKRDLIETDHPALVLQLTSWLLFQASTNCMLHAPEHEICVAQVIGTLTGRIPPEQHQLLSHYQSLVVKYWVAEGEEAQVIRSELDSLTRNLKNLVL